MKEDQNGKNTSKTWYSRGYMPHLDEFGLLQSITFRLADSLPQKLLKDLEEELKSIDSQHIDLERRKKIESYLDSGLGCCALAHPKMAEVMQNALLKFDGDRYDLLAWCIMPNHVHVLIRAKAPLSKIVQSWKSFTGRWALAHNDELGLGIPVIDRPEDDAELELSGPEVNAELELSGPEDNAELELSGPRKHFWMREYWDRYIRNESHLYKTINYIHQNPVKAGLCKKAEQWPWSSLKLL